MMNRTLDATIRALAAACLAGVAGVSLTACGGDKNDQQSQLDQPRERPEPRPRVDPMAELDIDPRVQFPEQRAPATRELAQAVADLASAIAAGDADRLRQLVDAPTEAVLDELVESGAWEEETGDIEVVRVVNLESEEGVAKVGFAVQDPRGAYLLGWEGSELRGGWVFTGFAVDGAPEAARAAELDGAALVEAALPEPGPESAANPEELRPPVDEDNRRRRRSGGRRMSPGLGPG